MRSVGANRHFVSFSRDRVVNESAMQQFKPPAGDAGADARSITMPTPTQPSDLSSDQRRRELVSLLAAGVLRLRKQRLLSGETAAPNVTTASKSAAGRLEVSGETVLSVHTG